MNLRRVAAYAGAGGALVAWLAATATSGVRERVEAPPVKPAEPDHASVELASQIARLHNRLRPDATPRQPSRNLFAFVSAVRRPAALAVPAPVAAAGATTAASTPPFRLAGLAEDAGPQGSVRTAIISGPGELFLVKEGDSLTVRTRVRTITPELVELTDVSDGRVIRLPLR